jgi:hypothetical protein
MDNNCYCISWPSGDEWRVSKLDKPWVTNGDIGCLYIFIRNFYTFLYYQFTLCSAKSVYNLKNNVKKVFSIMNVTYKICNNNKRGGLVKRRGLWLEWHCEKERPLVGVTLWKGEAFGWSDLLKRRGLWLEWPCEKERPLVGVTLWKGETFGWSDLVKRGLLCNKHQRHIHQSYKICIKNKKGGL